MDLTGFIVDLFILLAAAVLVGELTSRLGQTALVGQLLVGVVLGPTLLGPYLGLSTATPGFSGIQFLATFFILVMAGLEVSIEEIYATGLASGLLGIAVFVGPFLVAALLVPVLFPGLPSLTSLFVALTLSITALPVMGVMLREFGIVRSRLGRWLMNAAVINELAAVTVFAVLLRLGTGSSLLSAIAAVVSVALFLTTVLTAHMALRALRSSPSWERLRRHFHRTWRSREAGFAVLMVMALGSALYSQFLGLTFLVGAFYAGLLITPQSAGPMSHRSISQVFDAMTWGFFIPLFFAFVGLGMNLRLLAGSPSDLAVFAGLVALAIVGKVVFGAAVARLMRWAPPQAMAIGFFVSSRGAVELAMAVILLQSGVFSTRLYTIVAAVGLVTTVVAPIGAAYYGGLRLERRPTDMVHWRAPETDAPLASAETAAEP